MTRTTSGIAVVAAVALPIGAGACGGSDQGSEPSAAGSPSVVEADFLSRADDVCAPYAKYNADHLLRVKGFSRFDPAAALMPRVGAFLDRNPAFHTLVAELRELGEPPGDAAGWDAVVADFAAGEEVVQEEVAAARAGDADAFVAAENDRAASSSALHADLLAAGVAGDSPCLSAQGDPLQTTTSMH
jgi:hypothetical protein